MFLFRTATSRQLNLSLTIVRIASGLVMAAHGYDKVFSKGISTITAFFGAAGVPVPGLTGPFISILELVGGIALALGLLTRPFALLLAIDMCSAAALVHLKNGFLLPNGAEFVLLLAALYIALFISGGGPMSVDSMFSKPDTNTTR